MQPVQTVTCTSCNVVVTGSESLRTHYRSEHHLVNVKRRVAGLPSISAADFSQRLSEMRAAEIEAEKGKRGANCDTCQKRFASQKSLQNHEASRRHRDKVRSLSMTDTEWMSTVNSSATDKDEALVLDVLDNVNADVEIVLEDRLTSWRQNKGYGGVFDDEWFMDVEEALRHLKTMGLFIPFFERLRDMKGMVKYLSQKVGVGFACVRCDKVFGGAEACRKHMIDVGHAGMTDDEEGWMLEYGEFYDWSGEVEDEWEEIDGECEDAMNVVATRSVGIVSTNIKGPIGAIPSSEMGTEEEVGLIVGDKVLGHRSLRRYYRQHIGESDKRVAIVAAKKERRMELLSKRAAEGKLPLRMKWLASHRQSRFDLAVGQKNYYTRKATFKQKLVVLNSGYRA